jgi:peptidoglycan/LPS O-acetylase OafA/YrhL
VLNISSTIEHTRDITYRADIDGLRAIAVLSVVLYHAWPKWFVSGFIGVDVFFVISGYLISSIIISQLERGHFSIFEFYSRRIRRIFPALIVVLLATICFGWVVLLQMEFKQLGKHVAAGSGFVSNLVLWNESGYFDNLGVTKPLLHLWSLGVEEQFYVFWPLILWTVFTKRLSFLYVIAAIFCVSMAANLSTVESDPTAAFFSPLTRFWELMSGGIAAYLHLHRKTWAKHTQQFASMSGAALLISGFALIKPQNLFPSWWAVLPVAGTFLLIMAGPMAIVNRHLLKRKEAVGLGRISYPFYLWHWPLLSFAFILYGEKPSYQVKIALIFAALSLAFLTYRFLEVPLRAKRSRVTVIKTLSLAMVSMLIVGVLVNVGSIRERIDANGAGIYLDALNDSDFPGPTFVPVRHQQILFQKVRSHSSGLTVFLGDSVVQQYGPYIEHTVASDPAKFHSVIFATAGGCPPIRHTIRLPLISFPLCPKAVEAAYDLANEPGVDTVVIGAAWYGYFSSTNHDLLFDDGTVRKSFPGADAMEDSYESLRQSIALLTRNGKRVYLILQPPSGPAFDPRSMYEGSRFGSIRPIAKIEDVALDKYLLENSIPRNRLRTIANDTGAKIIEPTDFLCKGNICPVTDSDGTPLYMDSIHMRPQYSRSAAVFLEETISSHRP